MVKALPTGTITFLFTDIEGSTRLVRSVGDRFADILNEHHRLLREAFAKARGFEIGTEGDAFFVVFASAEAAVEAAVRVQQALAAHDWDKDVDVRVRMGLHTGSGTLAGDNYVGIDVHRAARIASAAHGGQIVISDTTRALVRGSLGDGLRLKDLGEHVLKDLERPEHLYQLCIDGLRSEFPPPRSMSSRPNNLPVTLTSFIARDRELEDILGLLADNRLVTLTGPGGTGKTRLGLRAASEVLFEYEHGAFVLFLAPVVDSGLVPSTIAEALGLREQGTRPISDSLKDYLSARHTLLVLDNFEHILPAARFVSDLLTSAPRLKILITSRATLKISGEHEYPVSPLALPDPERLPSLNSLAGYGAVELFIDRARAVKPDFALTEQNARAIAEICWRLDGLPLAIELAAARVRLLSPKEMVGRLERSLALLTGGGRDVPARQQTLRGTILWSYDLLDKQLRSLFRRIGIFVGGWDLAAVEEICNPDGELGVDTLDALEGLAENSLIRPFETESDITRFRMLQTIREFALETLSDDEMALIKKRHAEYFLGFVEGRSDSFTKDNRAVADTSLEHDNIRAVLRWAIDNSETDVALRMTAALWRFWMLQSHLAEGRQWLTETLAIRAATPVNSLRARALMALGSITYWQNEFEATRRHYLDGLEIFRELDDRSALGEALYNVGFLHLIERDPENARLYYEESRRIAEERSDDQGLANTAWALGMCALQERDWETARIWARETVSCFTALDDWFGASLGDFVFYQVARMTGDYPEARRLMLQALERAERRSDETSVYSALESLSAVDAAQGWYERALKLGGAASAFKDSYGGGAPPALMDTEDPKETARGHIDEARISQLWREGRAMPLEEAVALARKDPTDV